MIPATYDFTVVRGTSGPTQGITFSLTTKDGDDELPIPYEDIRLTVYNKKTLLYRLALSNGKLIEVDPVNKVFAWQPTTEQTRELPLGPKATYELEVWNGSSEIVYLMGTINAIGGINDDQDGTNAEDDPS